MPESVTDRPTKAHEQLFLFTKSSTYYYDAEAVREPQTGNAHSRGNGEVLKAAADGSGTKNNGSFNRALVNYLDVPGGRNLRSVWSIATEAYPGAHFATMPRKLVEPCIKAGCPPGGLVFDPFVGSGTVLVVAEALQRRAMGMDLSREYLGLAHRRVNRPHARVPRPAVHAEAFALPFGEDEP